MTQAISLVSIEQTFDGRLLTDASDDGLSACPICGKRMKEEQVFPHLDIHNDTCSKSPEPDFPIRPRSHYFPDGDESKLLKPMDRLPQINYSLLKDNALRKKLSELGIPNTGPRALIMRRHTEWINLVNANCDSRSPRTKRDLLRDLEIWDRAQGRQISSGTSSSSATLMHKDFDGAAWATSHDSEFKRLIAEARRKAQTKQSPNDGNPRTMVSEVPSDPHKASTHSLNSGNLDPNISS